MTTTTEQALPPLPEPEFEAWFGTVSGSTEKRRGFTADQMREYALAALAATQSAQNSQVDWLGLALDLEQQAKRVESQTVERSMLAAAHGLRLMGAAQSAQPQEPFNRQHEEWRHDSEELEALHMCLDDARIPRADDKGATYSAWGRVLRFKEANLPDFTHAQRFLWLCEDHADEYTRKVRDAILSRMSGMGIGAICQAIDYAMMGEYHLPDAAPVAQAAQQALEPSRGELTDEREAAEQRFLDQYQKAAETSDPHDWMRAALLAKQWHCALLSAQPTAQDSKDAQRLEWIVSAGWDGLRQAWHTHDRDDYDTGLDEIRGVIDAAIAQGEKKA